MSCHPASTPSPTTPSPAIRPRDYASAQRVAARLSRTREDAEDAVQDACVLALRDLGALRDAKAVQPWLCRITRNCCATTYRQRDRRGCESLDALAASIDQPVAGLVADPTPAETLAAPDRALLRRHLAIAIASLGPARRRAFVLRFVAGLSALAISKRTRVPLSTVKLHILQARQQLAARLQPLAASLGLGGAAA